MNWLKLAWIVTLFSGFSDVSVFWLLWVIIFYHLVIIINIWLLLVIILVTKI